MNGRPFLLALIACACLAGAAGCVPVTRGAADPLAPGGRGGALYVYLDRWPQDAAGLKVRLASVAAVRDDGAAVPLTLALADLDARSVTGPRLLARGTVPAGRYTGLAVRADAARLDGPEGEAGLRVADEAQTAPFGFDVRDRLGTVLQLRVDARASLAERGLFRPAFAGLVAPPPALGVLGVVACSDANVVAFVDKRSGAVGRVVPTGRRPRGLALDRERRRGFVAAAGDDALETIDLEQGTVLERRLLRGGDEPYDVELTPDRRTLLVANRGSGTLSFVDPDGLAELDRVEVGNGPSSVRVERNGRRAFVTLSRAAAVVVVDLVARRVAGSIPVEAGPFEAQFNRAQDRLLVVHDGPSFVTLIDVPSLAVGRRLNVGGGATALRVDPRTDRIYVARRDGSAIDVYDPLSLLPVDSIAARGPLAYLAIEGETNVLAAVHAEPAALRAIALVSRSGAWSVDLPPGPSYVSFLGER